MWALLNWLGRGLMGGVFLAIALPELSFWRFVAMVLAISFLSDKLPPPHGEPPAPRAGLPRGSYYT